MTLSSAAQRISTSSPGKQFTRIDAICIVVAQLVFWMGVLRYIDLPGIYMDAVNPDYLAARTLNPSLHNPVWALPTAIFPILGNLYHGVQNYYIDLITFSLIGITPTSIRLSQALFGAGIVVLLYIGVRLATRNRLAAFVGSVLLATDIAFLMSFRTQFYIVLGGEMWLFVSIAALLHGGRRGYLVSGICMGLAVYGYFVLGFFVPALFICALLLPNRRMAAWFLGGIIGSLPYILGYASMAIKLGGVHNLIALISGYITALAPTASQVQGVDKITYAFQIASMALSDMGNELMIFQRAYSSAGWPWVKAWALVFITLAGLACIRRSRVMLLALLPVSWMVIATGFGSRLGAHHYSVLVPIAYLLAAMLVGHHLSTTQKQVTGKRAAFCIIAIFVAGMNLYQGSVVYRALDETGGAGRMSSALTRLADDAWYASNTLYVFPDWGFFMPFALLTQNRIPYVLDIDKIEQEKHAYHHVEIAFWSPDDAPKYRDILTRSGASQITEKAYLQRDGHAAFQVLIGDFKNDYGDKMPENRVAGMGSPH